VTQPLAHEINTLLNVGGTGSSDLSCRHDLLPPALSTAATTAATGTTATTNNMQLSAGIKATATMPDNSFIAAGVCDVGIGATATSATSAAAATTTATAAATLSALLSSSGNVDIMEDEDEQERERSRYVQYSSLYMFVGVLFKCQVDFQMRYPTKRGRERGNGR